MHTLKSAGNDALKKRSLSLGAHEHIYRAGTVGLFSGRSAKDQSS